MRNELSITSDVGASLFGEVPVRAAEALLAYVVERLDARGGAVFRVNGLSLTPFAWERSIASHAAIEALWRRDGNRLRIEDETSEKDVYLLALRKDDGSLLGVLALDGPSSYPRIDQIRTLLAGALISQRTRPSDFDEEIRKRTPDEIERCVMLSRLDAEDWNISRAARKLGITRRTLYQRLVKYGIPRARVTKAGTKRTVTA